MSLISISLQIAFREPGCPVCRIRQETERRYLFHLMYEGVNDGMTRMHLIRSLGLCPEHAWALQATEQEWWHDGLGIGIIYEDLARRVHNILSASLARSSWARLQRRTRWRRWLEERGRAGRWLARWLPAGVPAQPLLSRLSPSGPCRACELVGESVETHLSWLVRQMADREFRERYAASDGLCLPHLRRALEIAEDEEAVRCLVEVAATKLDDLVTNLKEYVRKHDWNNRAEPKYAWEQASWLRAVAFFAGEAPEGREEEVYRLRCKALADYRARLERP